MATAVLAGWTGCSGGSAPTTSSLARFDGGARKFLIDEFHDGRCQFDYRAQVSLIGSDGKSLWVRNVPWIPDAHSALVETAEVVIVATEGPTQKAGLAALDAESGRPQWQRTGLPGHVQQLLVSSDDAIAFGATYVASYELRTGLERWRIEASAIWNDRPAVRSESAGTVQDVVLATPDDVRAVDSVSGRQRWSTGIVSYGLGPAVSDAAGVAVFVGEDRHLVALDLSTGAERWRAELGVRPDQIMHIDATSVAVLARGKLLIFSLDTGAVRHTARLGRDRHETALTVDQGIVYRSARGLITFVDATDGSIAWRAQARLPGDTLRDAAADEQHVYVVTDNRGFGRGATLASFAISTGALVWSSDVGLDIAHSLERGSENVLVGGIPRHASSDMERTPGRLMSLDTAKGETVWDASLRDAVQDVRARPDGRLLVVSSDDSLFCD